MKETPKYKTSIECQRTIWFEIMRIAAFLNWEWLALKVDGKTIMNIIVDGKKQGVKFDIKKVMQ